MSKADGQVTYEVRADNDKIKSDLDESNKIVEKEAGKLGKTAKKAATGIGIALAAATVAAVTFGSEFETSFAKASTLSGDVEVDVDNLQQKILELSDESGIAANELNEGLYSALSAGVPITENAEEAISFLEKSTKLAKAGFTDVDTAISATAKTLNAYGLEISEADRIQGILINTQNLGITTVDELGAVLSNVTPTASAAGVSFEEVGAALALMTAQGTPAAQATTQLNSSISAFLKPNKEMVGGLKNIVSGLIDQGKITGDNADLFKIYKDRAEELTAQVVALDETSETYKEDLEGLQEATKLNEESMAAVTAEMGLQVIESEGLQGSLELLNEEFDGSTNKMAGALGSSEALKASLAITGENAGKFQENLASMNDTAGLVDQTFDKVSNTTREKFNKNLNELKNVLIEVFLQLQGVTNAIFEFIEAAKAGETWIKLLALAIATITTLIIAYNIQQALATSGLTLWAAIAGGASVVTTALATALAFLTSPIGLIILAIAALIAIGILLVENWDVIKEFLVNTWETISDTAKNVFGGIKDFLKTNLGVVGEIIAKVFDTALGSVMDKFNLFKDTIISVVGNVKAIFENLMDFIKNVFTGNWEEAWENVKNIFGNVFEAVKTLAFLPLNFIITHINSLLKGLNGIKIPDWVPGVGGKSFSIPLIPKLAKGGLAFGETQAIVGDNPNANTDPEVIAPLSKLKSMLVDFMPFGGISANKQSTFDIRLNATVEVDGVELGEVVLNNIDESRQFI